MCQTGCGSVSGNTGWKCCERQSLQWSELTPKQLSHSGGDNGRVWIQDLCFCLKSTGGSNGLDAEVIDFSRGCSGAFLVGTAGAGFLGMTAAEFLGTTSLFELPGFFGSAGAGFLGRAGAGSAEFLGTTSLFELPGFLGRAGAGLLGRAGAALL